MSRHEAYMKAKLEEENAMQELLRKQANAQSDNVIDMVNSPPHYNQQGVECIDAIHAATDAGFEYYLQGNIMKYVWRYRYKNGKQDLQKAAWYLEKLIETCDES